MNKKCLLASIAILLSGCAGTTPEPIAMLDTRYTYNHDLSYANNVMRSVGVTDIKDAKYKGRVRKGGVSAIGITAGTALDYYTDVADIGQAAAGWMNVFFWLNNDRSPAVYSRYFIWEDESAALSPKQTQDLMLTALIEGIKKQNKNHKISRLVKPYSGGKYITSSLSSVKFHNENCKENLDSSMPTMVDCIIGTSCNGQ